MRVRGFLPNGLVLRSRPNGVPLEVQQQEQHVAEHKLSLLPTTQRRAVPALRNGDGHAGAADALKHLQQETVAVNLVHVAGRRVHLVEILLQLRLEEVGVHVER